MSLRSRMGWLLVMTTLVSCDHSAPAAPPDEVRSALAVTPYRLAVVFLPELSGCSSCDQMISAVISEWQAMPGAETVVVSVVPDRPQMIDPSLPGAIVRLKLDKYKRYKGTSPLPRVEIWGADGSLLLSRSVPNNGIQAELLIEEMLAARSFTAPAGVVSRNPRVQ